MILVDPYPRTLDLVAHDLEVLFAGRLPLHLQRADPATVGRLRSRPIG